MNISDRCSCGSEFHIDVWSRRTAAEMWVTWLNTHKQHRGEKATIEVQEI